MRKAMTILAVLLAGAPGWAAGKVKVVAAENMYGDIAAQIGGPDAQVGSILSNPDQDPHLFEAAPSTAREIAAAKMVIVNGAGYDPWMQGLIAAAGVSGQTVITVADLLHVKPGANPHLWYDPAAAPALARALEATLAKADPAHAAGYQARTEAFLASLRKLGDSIAALRARCAGTPITATEPVFNDMAEALGLVVRGLGFQTAIMNDTEPSPADVAAFEDDLRGHKVRLLLYNTQATDALTRRMRALAGQSGIPVVGVSETEPPGTSYQDWLGSELDALAKALEHR